MIDDELGESRFARSWNARYADYETRLGRYTRLRLDIRLEPFENRSRLSSLLSDPFHEVFGQFPRLCIHLRFLDPSSA